MTRLTLARTAAEARALDRGAETPRSVVRVWLTARSEPLEVRSTVDLDRTVNKVRQALRPARLAVTADTREG